MKGILSISLLLVSLGCFAQKGFFINGKVDGLDPPSMVYFTYQNNGGEVTDSTMIENGAFKFKGEVSEPGLAQLQIKHTESSATNYWGDILKFYIENATMEITSNGSIENATISGSEVNDQNKMLSDKVRPLIQNIADIRSRYKNKPKDEVDERAIDSAKALKNGIASIYRDFATSNYDSYLALRYFYYNELNKDFDPEWAGATFNKFSQNLQGSELGKETLKKIELVRKNKESGGIVNFSQNTEKNEPFSMSSLRGKYVLVEFWASWCAPCRKENPNLKKLYKELKDENFEIVGVSLDSSKDDWVKAIKKDGLPWIQVSDLQGSKNEVAQLYNVVSIPQNFLIDPEGKIISKNLVGENLSLKLKKIFGKSK